MLCLEQDLMVRVLLVVIFNPHLLPDVRGSWFHMAGPPPVKLA